MIAVFPTPTTGLCALQTVMRSGLKVVAIAYCGVQGVAGDGVMQISEKQFREGKVVGHSCCQTCRARLPPP